MTLACTLAVAVLAGSAAACSFSVGATPDARTVDPDALTDASIDAPDSLSAPPFCDPNEPSLVGCWGLETDTNDGSGRGNHATPTGTSYAAGKVGQGLVLQTGSLVSIPDADSLSPPTLTIEAWIKPSALPTGGARMGIFDNEGSYGFFLYEGVVQCTVSIAVPATVAILLDQWTHFACTFDGTTGRVYVNAVEVASEAGGGALGAGGISGSTIGSNSPSGDELIGMIDQVRVWNVARTPSQICNAADVQGCP